MGAVTIGNRTIQLGDSWRIAATDDDHLSIGHSGGKTARIFDKDGLQDSAHGRSPPTWSSTAWNPWFQADGSSRDLGDPNEVSFSSDGVLQIGKFRIGEYVSVSERLRQAKVVQKSMIKSVAKWLRKEREITLAFASCET